MGFKVPRDTPPMERELIYLIADLCVNWGFCIPPDEAERITLQKRYSSREFAEDIMIAEGMEVFENSSWLRKIAERFEERFGTTEIEEGTFVDRIRGIKENWNSRLQ